MTAWLIVGLGNPGPSYSAHRHNWAPWSWKELAARPVRACARTRGGRLRPRSGSHVHPGDPCQADDLHEWSGGPVAGLLSFYKVPVENLIVIHDDLDIPFAQVRLKFGGGEGGHNGLRSITKSVAPGSTCGFGWVSADRPGGWMPPTTCCMTSPAPSAARSPC